MGLEAEAVTPGGRRAAELDLGRGYSLVRDNLKLRCVRRGGGRVCGESREIPQNEADGHVLQRRPGIGGSGGTWGGGVWRGDGIMYASRSSAATRNSWSDEIRRTSQGGRALEKIIARSLGKR